MKYFAMIDGERRGPFDLSELHDAGVLPETYVWCKDMDDWEKAEDVADICRFYRRRIFDLMHPQASAPEPQTSPDPDGDPYGQFPVRYREFVRREGADPIIPDEPEEDLAMPPASMLPVSLVLTLLCCPVTGLVAIYWSVMSRRAWEEMRRGESKSSKKLYTDEERSAYSRMAHDYARKAKMWCGITFFLGFILYAFIGNRFL